MQNFKVQVYRTPTPNMLRNTVLVVGHYVNHDVCHWEPAISHVVLFP